MADRLGEEEVYRALAEDHARSDVTTQLLGSSAERVVSGRFVAEERFVVAGLPVVNEVFYQLDAGVEIEGMAKEGDWVDPGTGIASVTGPARVLLAAERTALNFLQRLSAIATSARRGAEAVLGTGAKITDTRKTTPGLRALEKYAVNVGGAANHRFSLADQILFKDNHWALLDGASLRDTLAKAKPGIPVVVEAENEDQLEQALAAGVKRILVDNLPPERVAAWVKRAGPHVAIEASGGITLDTALAYAKAGARYISIGTLTHSVRAVSVRFDITDTKGR